MITYLAKLIPNLSQVSTPFRQLLEKDLNGSWRKFWHAKLTSNIGPSYEVFWCQWVSVDASSGVLGTVLQDEQPIAYASKYLSRNQHNYAQIEKKILAIVCGCT